MSGGPGQGRASQQFPTGVMPMQNASFPSANTSFPPQGQPQMQPPAMQPPTAQPPAMQPGGMPPHLGRQPPPGMGPMGAHVAGGPNMPGHGPSADLLARRAANPQMTDAQYYATPAGAAEQADLAGYRQQFDQQFGTRETNPAWVGGANAPDTGPYAETGGVRVPGYNYGGAAPQGMQQIGLPGAGGPGMIAPGSSGAPALGQRRAPNQGLLTR